MNNAIVADSLPPALPVYPASGPAAAYLFLRHTGFILNELSAQGLVLWPDEKDRWHWRWRTTDLKSTGGFWVMGEAVVDAVIARYPETFAVSFFDAEAE